MVVNVTHDKSITTPFISHTVLNIDVGFKKPLELSLPDDYVAPDAGNQHQEAPWLYLPYVVLLRVIARTDEQTGL